MSTTQPIRNQEDLQCFKKYYLREKPCTRNYVLCIMGLNTALRISDILHLKWEDVYDYSKEALLSHISITEQKTGKINRIAVNKTLAEALMMLFASYRLPPKSQDYLFQSRKGKNCPLSRSQAFRIIREAACRTGMEQSVSCHSLRKTFGYHAWRQGVPPALLMDIYNHSSYQITKRYLGIEQDDKDKVFLNISL